MRAIEKCVIQREVHGKRRRGRPTSNMIPPNGSITKWMGENGEEIMRDLRDRAIDGDNWCELAR